MTATLSLGAAARLTGISKTRLTRAIRAGLLPATRKDDWVLQIPLPELQEFAGIPVAPQPAPRPAVAAPAPRTAPPAPGWSARLGARLAEVFGLRGRAAAR